MTDTAPDFLAYAVPSMAVACPDCSARIGARCKRPSGHTTAMLHKARHTEADRLWLAFDLPTITHRPDGYFYDGPQTRPSAQRNAITQGATTMKTKTSRKGKTSKARKSTARRAKPKTGGARRGKSANTSIARATAADARARKTTKADELAAFLTVDGGRSIEAVCAEFGWLPHSARAAISRLGSAKGLKVKTEKADGATRYEIAA